MSGYVDSPCWAESIDPLVEFEPAFSLPLSISPSFPVSDCVRSFLALTDGGTAVPRGQALVGAHLPPPARGRDVGQYPRGAGDGPRAADQGQLDRGQQEGQRDHHLHALVQPQKGRQHGRRPGQLPRPAQGQARPRAHARERHHQPPQQDQGREAARSAPGARGPPQGEAEEGPGHPPGAEEGGGQGYEGAGRKEVAKGARLRRNVFRREHDGLKQPRPRLGLGG